MVLSKKRDLPVIIGIMLSLAATATGAIFPRPVLPDKTRGEMVSAWIGQKLLA